MSTANKSNAIECRGTAFEIGRQYGEAAFANIVKTLNMGMDAITVGYKVTRADVLNRAMKYLPKVKEFDPYLIEMLEGQAEGAGIDFEEAFTVKCFFDLLFNYSKLGGMCTSFAVSGKAARGGKTILGQTVDWSPGSPVDLLKVHHANGLVQLILSVWGFEYTLSSAGFGMCANGTWGAEKGYPEIPFSCYAAKAMRQDNMQEALQILRRSARGLSYFHLADRGGEIVGLESTLEGYNQIQPEKNMLVHANHYQTLKYKPKDLYLAISPDSRQRQKRMKKLLKQHYGDITPELMQELLADHENYPNSVCKHIDPSKPPQFHAETLAAFVMVPEDGKMFVCVGNPCSNRFVEYQI